jgi:predicted dithiol-disulfide oxidoreductase (DUF899 family)
MDHKVVGPEEWEVARADLVEREKEHTRAGDELARERRELPWVAVDEEYRFDAEDGTRTLAELFDGRSQLLVYHFMFGPTYEAGCPSCSSMADGMNGLLPHLDARDLTLVFVSRAPLEKLQAYKERMGWSIPWASSANTDFSFDMDASFTDEQVREFMPMVPDTGTVQEEDLPPIAGQNAAASGTDVLGYVAEIPATNAFALDDGAVYRTYATTLRGIEFMMGFYPILDRAPKGRDENGDFQTWIRRHDEY